MNKFKFISQPRVFEAEGAATGGAPATPEVPAVATPEGGEAPAAKPSLLSQAAGQGKPPVPAEGGSATVPAEGAQSEGGEAPTPFDISGLALPEGFELPEEVGTAFADLLNDPALTRQELGQKLLDMQIAQAQAASTQMSEASSAVWNEMNEAWRAELAALPEFKDTDKALGDIKTVLVGMGAGDDFFRAMDVTGAGNNPHVMVMLQKLTAPHVEGAAVSGSTAKTPANAALTLYPTMKK